MAIIAYILNIIKGITQIKDIGKWILENKFITILLLIAGLGATYFSSDLVKKIPDLIKGSSHNKTYNMTSDLDVVNFFVDKILLDCGEKTGITISAVNRDYNHYEDLYYGRFYVARACDNRNVETNCLVDLKHQKLNPYSVRQDIDPNSYKLFQKLGGNDNAKRFYLRDMHNKQDLSSLSKYSAITRLVKGTDWFKEKSLYYLWVTSILSNDDVLYVITYLSGTSVEKSVCSNPSAILNNIKQFITEK